MVTCKQNWRKQEAGYLMNKKNISSIDARKMCHIGCNGAG